MGLNYGNFQLNASDHKIFFNFRLYRPERGWTRRDYDFESRKLSDSAVAANVLRKVLAVLSRL
jgi:hypothetical protein